MPLPPARVAAISAIAASLLLSSLTGLTLPASAQEGQDAPGAPGSSTTWRTGFKEGVGTSVRSDSKVWYTLAEGSLSEVYYPAADMANVRDLSFVVTDGSSFTQRERDNTRTVTELADPRSLTYRQVTTDEGGRWRLSKTYVTDPERSTVLIDVDFKSLKGGPYQLFSVYDASLANNARHDSGRSVTVPGGEGLVASDTHVAKTPVSSALLASSGFTETSTGYAGTSDGWSDLADDHRLTPHPKAGPGNIVQTGRIPVDASGTARVSLALGFGPTEDQALATARATLARPYAEVAAAYQGGWHGYLDGLKPAPKELTGALRTQYNAALMTVRAHEDKTYPGAFIASLTLPWGQRVNADDGGGGYHFVWSRDLYQQVTSLLAAGDVDAANRAVTWLFERQQEPDGHFPQTSQVDGTPDQRGIQLDETAFPIILAWQVGRFDADFYREQIKPAADYLVKAGPRTPQERWEETGGYSASTLASQIAGLTAAADLAGKAGDKASAAIYQGTADSWQRSLEKWLFTTTGPVGDGRYYMRINADEDPDDADRRDFGNGSGVHDERAVLDAGFLEFVRLGVKAPDDPKIAESLKETDDSISQETPSGRMWHRYTYDGYGEKADGSPWDGSGVGRLWPLLGGERGEYELANGRDALEHLRTMHNAANQGFMIPEQVWDKPEPTSYGHVFGEGTGSAGPLAWAMAQYVRLAQGLGAGRPVETPKVVAERYADGDLPAAPALSVTSPDAMETASGHKVRLTGTTDARWLYADVNGQRRRIPLPAGTGTRAFSVELAVPEMRNQVTVVAESARGGTNAATRTVLAYGNRVGGLQDPAGDDNGPGDYVYPTAGVYTPGTFDLRGTEVYEDGDSTVFVTSIDGPLTNPWGGDQISLQRVNIYLGQGTGDRQAALPGTNLDTASPWQRVIVQDGRFDSAGVYGPDGKKVADVELVALPEKKQVAAVVPKSALGTLDPAGASYGVAMFGNAEAGEGVGYVRPVYDRAYWDKADPWWIKEYRFGGGAGEWNDSPAHDTDTRDPNALDITVGPGQTQAEVMDWRTHAPVALPMVRLGD